MQTEGTETYLIDTVLVDGLLLVETSEATVVSLIESPVLGDGDPELVGLLEGEEEGLDGSLEGGAVGLVEL